MKREPAVLTALTVAAVNALSVFVFGEELTEQEQGAIAVLTILVGGWFTRSKVTPVA
jgi:hypothetical protein